jgi:hypothetical protein
MKHIPMRGISMQFHLLDGGIDLFQRIDAAACPPLARLARLWRGFAA